MKDVIAHAFSLPVVAHPRKQFKPTAEWSTRQKEEYRLALEQHRKGIPLTAELRQSILDAADQIIRDNQREGRQRARETSMQHSLRRGKTPRGKWLASGTAKLIHEPRNPDLSPYG